MKSSVLVTGIALAGLLCASAAQAVTLSCTVTDYRETAGPLGFSLHSNEKTIGSTFRVDTSAGWNATETQYSKSESFSGGQGNPINLSSTIDRESGKFERVGTYWGAGYTLTAVCKKVEVKVNM
jgi:hypothetical protein